jgi:NAD(P)-dependent dehydrogenase (short-subunit alcohol dehydrogenase family)
VAVADVDAAGAKETARLVNDEGSTAVAIVADVGDPLQIERMVSEARAGLDGLDGVVANVGIVGGWGLDQTSVEDWERVFAVNTRAHFLPCKYALPAMPAGSAIVLTSSIAALMPVNEVVAYHASKAALEGLCMWLAKHAAERGIRVQTFLAACSSPVASLAELALRAAYADQAHLSRETRILAGRTPVELRAARLRVRNVQDA